MHVVRTEGPARTSECHRIADVDRKVVRLELVDGIRIVAQTDNYEVVLGEAIGGCQYSDYQHETSCPVLHCPLPDIAPLRAAGNLYRPEAALQWFSASRGMTAV